MARSRIGYIGGPMTSPSGLPKRFREEFVKALKDADWKEGEDYELVPAEIQTGTKEELVRFRHELESLEGSNAVDAIVTLDSRALSGLPDEEFFDRNKPPIIVTATQNMARGRVGDRHHPAGRVTGVYVPEAGPLWPGGDHFKSMLGLLDWLSEVQPHTERQLGVLSYGGYRNRQAARTQVQKDAVFASAKDHGWDSERVKPAIVSEPSARAEEDDRFTFAPTRAGLKELAGQLRRGDIFAVKEDAIFNYDLYPIAQFANEQGWISVYPHRDYVARTGHLSLGIDRFATIRQAALVTKQTIEGGRPAPMAIASTWELAINKPWLAANGITDLRKIEPHATHVYDESNLPERLLPGRA